MPNYVQLSTSGRNLSARKGKVHQMTYGLKAITPRNLNQVLFQIQAESQLTAGRPSAQQQKKPVVVRKEVDSSSPLLLAACCNQEVISSLNLYFTQGSPNGKEQVVATITLTNATIAGYRTWRGFPPPKHHPTLGASSVHTSELEQFELTFERITYTHVRQSKCTSDDWTNP